MEGVANISNGHRKAIQELILDYAIDIERVDKTTDAESIEIRVWEPIRDIAQIDVLNQHNMIAWYNLKTGSMEVVNLSDQDINNNSRTYNVPQSVIGEKYVVPELKLALEGPALNTNTMQESFFMQYEYQGEKYPISELRLDKDIDFDGEKPNITPEQIIAFRAKQEADYNKGLFLNMLPEGSKFNSVTTENRYGSTMYNYQSKGVPLTFSTVDGEQFYVWGAFGKKEVFTGESFKLSEVDSELKIDVDALKEKFAAKPQEKVEPQAQSAAPKIRRTPQVERDERPYDISIENIRGIKTVGTPTQRWGRNYAGDRHDVMEAVVFAAKEANVNPKDLAAFIEHESGLNPNLKSPTHATGLGQFTTSTWNYVAHGVVKREIKNETVYKFEGYDVIRDGKKFNCLKNAYPEFDWGEIIKNHTIPGRRTDMVVNAIATAHYMSDNMRKRDTDDATVGYISHNLGPGGCSEFMRTLAADPHKKCHTRDQIVNNPVNYTDRGVPLTHMQAFKKIEGHLDNSRGMAVQKGFNEEEAEKALKRSTKTIAEDKPHVIDKTTGSVGDELKQQGVQPYSGQGFLPKEVMDNALAQVQARTNSQEMSRNA